MSMRYSSIDNVLTPDAFLHNSEDPYVGTTVAMGWICTLFTTCSCLLRPHRLSTGRGDARGGAALFLRCLTDIFCDGFGDCTSSDPEFTQLMGLDFNPFCTDLQRLNMGLS
ncbi:hypothetical protein SARC_11209 [Sphaeroforma arctica JP610]|uniref:Uncharacterized protein n=1 Tax=Sphaeroforma arctica JP610 TaxID=667725 RepID=A0A0L0FHM7_9EUKA|nr:hypothetical protein SARC_11209 [Sphaeroforma arctica JP610]KNC76282.1 hypothetical protein SARC_11209 [Sphaeroforma arctica JP610]|eukprot:XP_014150184.1 hypothetical protein SARC_11209 [Sphaeroforma arctica JP610]